MSKHPHIIKATHPHTHILQNKLKTTVQDTHKIIFIIFLMAGTLTVYRWPVRRIKVKPKKKKKVLHLKKTLKKQTFR